LKKNLEKYFYNSVLSPELYEEIVDILDPDLIDIGESESEISTQTSNESGKEAIMAITGGSHIRT